VVIILGIAAGSHLLVHLLRKGSGLLVSQASLDRHPKIRSVIGLVTSLAIFGLYFAAVGFCFDEMGLSLTAYFASATVIGLAVGFGSQGVVQDVVTGLTLVFSDLIDVDDMVEIGGQVGIVKSIGMRFVVLENPLGAMVYIPNRSIGNVINYPKGYIRCIVDVTFVDDGQKNDLILEESKRLMTNFAEQFPGILVAPPSLEGSRVTASGKTYLRLKFRIWPGRGGALETTFRQELVKRLQAIEGSYSDWMVSVLYETEKPIRNRAGVANKRKSK
jgi:small conductance mechanosensitive channel